MDCSYYFPGLGHGRRSEGLLSSVRGPALHSSVLVPSAGHSGHLDPPKFAAYYALNAHSCLFPSRSEGDVAVTCKSASLCPYPPSIQACPGESTSSLRVSKPGLRSILVTQKMNGKLEVVMGEGSRSE